MPDILLSFMEKGNIEEAARVLSISMLDNPIHVAVFHDTSEKSRIEIEKDFIGLLSEKPGIVFVAKDKQKIIGVMRMNSCSGKDAADVKTDPEDENDIHWRKEFLRNQWDIHDPKEQHWHLGPIGVLPTYQGTGIGSMLMERFCSEVDACMAKAYLETDKDENVAFYMKFGFKIISDSVIFGVKSRYMLRLSK